MLFRFFSWSATFRLFQEELPAMILFEAFFFQPRIPIKIDEVAKNGLKRLANHFNPSSWNDNLRHN